MKKLIACILLLATMLTLLVSCGNADGSIGKDALPFNDVYRSDIEMEGTGIYKKTSSVSFPSSLSSAHEYYNNGKYFVYYNASRYYIYNVELDRTVLEVSTDIANSSGISCAENYIQIYDHSAFVTKVYLPDGTFLAETAGNVSVSTNYSEDDTFVFADKLYVMKNGTLDKTISLPPLVHASDCIITDNYIVLTNESNSVVYYDKDFKKVASYSIPGTASDFDIYFIGDKLFVQYELECKADAWSYTYIKDGCKYMLQHVLFDPATQKAKAMNLDVYVQELVSKREIEKQDTKFFTDQVQNVLLYQAIINHRIDESAYHGVLMDDEGKIGASLGGYIEGQKSIIYPVNQKYYSALTTSGYALLNANGELVAELPSLGSVKDYGLYSNNKIYGFDLKTKLDLSGSDYNLISSSNDHSLLYSKTVNGSTRYYRYDAAGEHELFAPSGNISYVSATEDYYYINYYESTNYSSRTAFYSFDGTLLFTSSGSYANTVARSDDAILVSYTDPNTYSTTYIRIAK